MKKIILFILLLILAIPFACRYKEGPLISFRSVKGRLEGTWQVVGFTSNGVDSLQYCVDSCGSNMKIDFPWDEAIYIIAFVDKMGGDFTFSKNKKLMNVDIHINSRKGIGPLGGNKTSEWEILKLTTTDFKISTEYNNRNNGLSII